MGTDVKKTDKKWYFPLVIALLLAGSFYLWQGQQTKIIRLGLYAGSSWSVPNSRANRVLDQAIQSFESSHPGVKVVYESGIPKEDYSDWLADQLVKGDQPDIFLLPEEDFRLLASSHALRPLDDLAAKKKEDFYPTSLAAGLYQGHQYALPFESNPIMMCVNKTLLEKNGLTLPQSDWTLEDFYRICQAVTKDTNGDGVLDQYGVTDYNWQQALVAYQGKLIQNGQLHLDSYGMRESLDFVTKLTLLNQHYEVTAQDFDQGKVAFYPLTLAQYRTYKPYPYHVSKFSNFAWTCIPMPSQIATQNATQVSTSLFAMSSRAKYISETEALLQLLCSDSKVQQNLVEKSQGMSVLPAVMKSQATADLLKDDDFGADSLTAERLDTMMKGAVPDFSLSVPAQTLEQVDYLIGQSLKKPDSDLDLVTLQKKIEQTSR